MYKMRLLCVYLLGVTILVLFTLSDARAQDEIVNVELVNDVSRWLAQYPTNNNNPTTARSFMRRPPARDDALVLNIGDGNVLHIVPDGNKQPVSPSAGQPEIVVYDLTNNPKQNQNFVPRGGQSYPQQYNQASYPSKQTQQPEIIVYDLSNNQVKQNQQIPSYSQQNSQPNSQQNTAEQIYIEEIILSQMGDQKQNKPAQTTWGQNVQQNIPQSVLQTQQGNQNSQYVAYTTTAPVTKSLIQPQTSPQYQQKDNQSLAESEQNDKKPDPSQDRREPPRRGSPSDSRRDWGPPPPYYRDWNRPPPRRGPPPYQRGPPPYRRGPPSYYDRRPPSRDRDRYRERDSYDNGDGGRYRDTEQSRDDEYEVDERIDRNSSPSPNSVYNPGRGTPLTNTNNNDSTPPAGPIGSGVNFQAQPVTPEA